MELVIRFSPGGGVRMICNDFIEIPNAKKRRASEVEPIQSGPFEGQWLVDMSPLGLEHQYCLWPPFRKRKAALKAEVKHLEEVWLKNKPTSS
jgi:hypothetical protein